MTEIIRMQLRRRKGLISLSYRDRYVPFIYIFICKDAVYLLSIYSLTLLLLQGTICYFAVFECMALVCGRWKQTSGRNREKKKRKKRKLPVVV